MNAERWPVDFESLQRGDTIPAEKVEESYGVSRMSRDYSLATLRLRDAIEAFWRDQYGEEVTVLLRKDDLVIATHQEQSEAARSGMQRGLRQLAKQHRKRMSVDLSLLSDEAANRHLADGNRSSWIMQQLRKRPPQIEEGKS